MSCLEKKRERKKKENKRYKTEVSRNKEIQSLIENDIRNIVSRNKETRSLKKQTKKNMYGGTKKMKQNMAVSTSQLINIIDVFSQTRCLVVYSVFVYIWAKGRIFSLTHRHQQCPKQPCSVEHGRRYPYAGAHVRTKQNEKQQRSSREGK